MVIFNAQSLMCKILLWRVIGSAPQIDESMDKLDLGEMAFLLYLLGKGSHCGAHSCVGPWAGAHVTMPSSDPGVKVQSFGVVLAMPQYK